MLPSSADAFLSSEEKRNCQKQGDFNKLMLELYTATFLYFDFTKTSKNHTFKRTSTLVDPRQLVRVLIPYFLRKVHS